MTSLHFASALFGSVVITLSILLSVHLWQRKEYRWDRMKAFLRSPESAPFRDGWLILFVVFIGAGWLGQRNGLPSAANVLGWVALVALAARHARLYQRFGLHRPELTTKGLVTLALAVATAVGILYGVIVGTQLLALQLASALLLLPIGVGLAVLVANGVAGAKKRTTIARAAQLRQAADVEVVAVTGSVGKTSVKEYIAHIVRAAGKRVAATQERRNSEYTVAQDMLEQLSHKPEVYVVEAAAYRAGEVAAIAKLARPTVGVITAVTNQHEALFGSVRAIADAKWEMAQGVKTLVVNGDDPVLKQRLKTARSRVVTVSSKEQMDVYATDISIAPEKITCQVHVRDTSVRVTLPLVGEGALTSALLAAAAAQALGISPQAIFSALATLPTLLQTMQLRTGTGGAAILDDSYSASEAAFKNAMSHLARFPQKDKRVVLVPIIELSQQGESVHENIGRALAKSDAKTYVFGRGYEQAIRRGLGGGKNIQWFENPKDLAESARAGLTSESVVLLEGRVPDMVRQKLIA